MDAKTQSDRSRAAERGFTLVEIMVVIVILGLLATLVVPNIMGASDEAKEGKARSDVKMIAEHVRGYYVKHGRLPETLEDLVTKDERGRSELEELPPDPWDTPYELVEGETSREFEVVSCGPDRSLGTDDDISSKSRRDN
ncbi:MAG TPA: type II secretion system protein GspG [bacterium]|nr:type II secretion system protein GspG [bacterium]